MSLNLEVVRGIFEQLHYQTFSDFSDSLRVKNVLGEERQFTIKLLTKTPQLEHYMIQSYNLSFITFENADEVYPVEFEFEINNRSIILRDYYYKLTNDQMNLLKSLYC